MPYMLISSNSSHVAPKSTIRRTTWSLLRCLHFFLWEAFPWTSAATHATMEAAGQQRGDHTTNNGAHMSFGHLLLQPAPQEYIPTALCLSHFLHNSFLEVKMNENVSEGKILQPIPTADTVISVSSYCTENDLQCWSITLDCFWHKQWHSDIRTKDFSFCKKMQILDSVDL